MFGPFPQIPGRRHAASQHCTDQAANTALGQMPLQQERLKQAVTKAATCFNLKLIQRQVLSKLNDLQIYGNL